MYTFIDRCKRILEVLESTNITERECILLLRNLCREWEEYLDKKGNKTI